jgi:hypothetical protein
MSLPKVSSLDPVDEFFFVEVGGLSSCRLADVLYCDISDES